MPRTKNSIPPFRGPIQSIRHPAIAAAVAAVFALPFAAFSENPGPWVAPSKAASKKNPYAGSAEAAASGKHTYTSTCSITRTCTSSCPDSR